MGKLGARTFVLGLFAVGLLAAPTLAVGLAELDNTIADVAEKVKPGVVSLETERDAPAVELPTVPNVPGRRSPLPQPRPNKASGSGMLFRATNDAYYILTNAHVVRGAKSSKVKVKLVAEREEREGVVLGADRLTDVAVVRMPRKAGDNLTTVAVGRSKDLRIGNLVLAVGSPFHFEATVTLGIISSLGRELDEPGDGPAPAPGAKPGEGPEPAHYSGLIQTDASINPGNSGGPLVNMKGEVVGINFAIYSPGMVGSSVGIGFAVPIEKAMAVVDDLIQRGRVSRGYLGVVIGDVELVMQRDKLTRDEIKALYGTDQGAFVQNVQPGTPAAKAGLQMTDVIVGLEGTPVASVRELQDRVRELKPGVALKMDLLRDKKKVTVPLTLAELPTSVTGDEPAPRPAGPTTPAAGRDPLGLQVEAASAADLAKIGANNGLKVTGVEPDSLAGQRELPPPVGTLLVQARRADQDERIDLKDADAWRTFIAKAAADKAMVLVWAFVPGEDGKLVAQTFTFSFKAPAPADK